MLPITQTGRTLSVSSCEILMSTQDILKKNTIFGISFFLQTSQFFYCFNEITANFYVVIATLFKKKRRGYCYRLCPSVCQLCYLLLNHCSKSNQSWCVSYSRECGVQQQIQFWPRPPPGAWGRGQKVKYHQISITKSISKICILNFKCVLTNNIYKTFLF